MYFRDAGSGAALLLLHALPVDGRMWDEQTAALKESFRVVVPDFRGFGRSAPPDGSPSLDDIGHDIVSGLRSIGIDRAVVAGCSMGGYVGLAILRAAPEFVRGFALVNSRAGADSDEQRAARSATIEKVRADGCSFLLDGALAAGLSPVTFERRLPVVARVKAMVAAATPAGVIAAHRAIGARPDSRSMLKQLRIPVAIVHGEDDAVVPVAEARDLAASIPGATFTAIPEAGHLSSVEEPELVTSALRDLCARAL